MHDFALSVAEAFRLDASHILPAEDVSPHPDRLGLDSTFTMQRLQLPHPGLTHGPRRHARYRTSPLNLTLPTGIHPRKLCVLCALCGYPSLAPI